MRLTRPHSEGLTGMNTATLLVLLSLRGVGRATVQYLTEVAPDLPCTTADILDRLSSIRGTYRRFRMPVALDIEEAIESAMSVLWRSQQLGIHVIGIGESAYPRRLKAIDDPPLILYAKGCPTVLNSIGTVAVVGTRKPSPYGERAAARFGAAFAELGLGVVSGLAVGCDAAAHTGCLSVGGQTISVLAHGLDSVYPAKNRELARHIVESNGCLVSEYPPGQPPRKNTFVERDRLQSGISDGVVVVETDITGGTMHTVRFCLTQRRVLGCLSHPPEHQSQSMANGNRQLIESGQAIPLAARSDIERFARLLVQSEEPASTLNLQDAPPHPHFTISMFAQHDQD
jgi:DNA processing protein